MEQMPAKDRKYNGKKDNIPPLHSSEGERFFLKSR